MPTLQHKNNESEPSVERAVDSGQTIGRQVFIKVLKCSVKSCTTFCLDETALKKHLETDHKSGIVDSVENELNEDMSEDIGKEGDELNCEDNNQSTEEPNSSQTKPNVEVLAESGEDLKSETVFDIPKNKQLAKRVSVGSGQTDKNSTVGSMVKCIIVGCNTQCRDRRGLEKHLEVVHRLMYIKSLKQTSNPISVETRRAPPVPSRPSLPSPLDINVEPVLTNLRQVLGQGCHLEKQTKEVILNLKQYFTALFPDETVQTIVDTIR